MPFYFFFGWEGSPTEIDYREKTKTKNKKNTIGFPYSDLSTGPGVACALEDASFCPRLCAGGSSAVADSGPARAGPRAGYGRNFGFRSTAWIESLGVKQNAGGGVSKWVGGWVVKQNGLGSYSGETQLVLVAVVSRGISFVVS